jgi:hypothetical protein
LFSDFGEDLVRDLFKNVKLPCDGAGMDFTAALEGFSERNALGVQTSVYDVNRKNWIARSESLDDIEQGKGEGCRVCVGVPTANCRLEIAIAGVEEIAFSIAPDRKLNSNRLGVAFQP